MFGSQRERGQGKYKIGKLATRSKEVPDENCRVLIKKGPVSVVTSLKELEENYAFKPEWKMIEDGVAEDTAAEVAPTVCCTTSCLNSCLIPTEVSSRSNLDVL